MLSFVQVDAFAQRPFEGNSAVVCHPGDPLEPSLMQRIAREMNVSETCFLVPDGEDFQLRWFTPTVEVDLCGHATLAAAHALWNEWGYESETIRFQTLSGRLGTARRDGLIWLDFPAEPADEISAANGLVEAIGARAVFWGRNRLDYLVQLESEEAVRSLQPNLVTLRSLGSRGVIVTARADRESELDFVLRYFAPAAGIDEDPVTGSAQCALGPYWSARLGKKRLAGFQASERGGFVRVQMNGDRVEIGGSAVTVVRGTLSV